jgi:Flp pilus assembly protein TadB
MPTAKPVQVEPRLRDQALPEKSDDRFFDRWAFDWARRLGEDAIKAEVVRRFFTGLRAFALWRSYQHTVVAEQESVPDVQIVASAEARINKAEGEVALCDEAAKQSQEQAKEAADEATASDAKRLALRPALRGSRADGVYVLLADLVLFAVDLLVLHLTLRRVPASGELERWLTAIAMGGGAVLVGSILGWLGAAAVVPVEGGFRRPAWPFALTIAALGVLAVGFFLSLGEFRSASLELMAARNGVHIANPAFFALAQIVFSASAALSAVSFFARRSGREHLSEKRSAEAERDRHDEEAAALHRKADQARREAAEVPIHRDEAVARMHSRKKIAEAKSKLDRHQGEYLPKLCDGVYHDARAKVELGIHYWAVTEESATDSSAAASSAPSISGYAATAGLLAVVAVLVLVGSLQVAVIAGIVVTGVLLAVRGRRSTPRDEQTKRQELSRAFKADVAPSSSDASPASDIDRLIPLRNGHRPDADADDLRQVIGDAS